MDHDGPTALRHNQDTLLALRTALKHAKVANDPKVVCNIGQACRDWRAAVKMSDAGLLQIKLDGWRCRPADLQNFRELGKWITQSPGIIGSLEVCGPVQAGAHNFRTAAESALADSVALAAAAPLAEERRCSSQLKLRSFVSINLGSARLLSTLPAAHLVRLELHVPHLAGDSHSLCGNNFISGDAKWLAATQQLTNLQQLRLSSAADNLPLGFLVALQPLQHLTYLNLQGVDARDAGDLQLLPTQLKQLEVGLTTKFWVPPALLHLQHLTQLQLLTLVLAEYRSQVDILPGSQLPPNITTLELTFSFEQARENGVYPLLEYINIAGLCKLQELSLSIRDDAEPQSTDPLVAMKHLTTVSLRYHQLVGAANAAPAWSSVPALQVLSLCAGLDDELDEGIFSTLMEGIKAATTLTSLGINFTNSEGPADFTQLRLCSYLVSLSNLQELTLILHDCEALISRDVLHLTALTGLSKLGVTGATARALDGLTAVALACCLTNLVVLDLGGCDSACLAAIPAIAVHLTRLESLDLSNMETLDDNSFLMLTTLRNLTRFSPDYDQEYGPSQEAWDTFWNLIRA